MPANERCGHSACSQHYIDTGDTSCVEEALSATKPTKAAGRAPVRSATCGCGRAIGPKEESQTRCFRCISTGCVIERRVFVRTFTMEWGSGTTSDKPMSVRWETKSCGSPLWSAQERESGICAACRSGWTHPNNYATDAGLAALAAEAKP